MDVPLERPHEPRPLSAVVLAAAEGARMRSERPKPLHLICGRPMIMHVLHAVAPLGVERTAVVVGHGADRVTKKIQEHSLPGLDVTFVEQHGDPGSADGVSVGLTAFPDDELDDERTIVVLPGDTPLLRPETVAGLVREHVEADNAATLLTVDLAEPNGLPRVVRGKEGRVVRVVSQREATPDELELTEVYTSIGCFRADVLGPAARRVAGSADVGEANSAHLSDVVAVLAQAGYRVGAIMAADARETRRVDDREQLASAEAELRRRTNRRWLLEGVTMLDPAQTFIDVTVRLGRDVTLYPGTMLQGDTVVGDGCDLGPDARLVDCHVGPGAVVENCVARRAEIGGGAHVGPFAVLEPGAVVAPGTRTGPFYTGLPEGWG